MKTVSSSCPPTNVRDGLKAVHFWIGHVLTSGSHTPAGHETGARGAKIKFRCAFATCPTFNVLAFRLPFVKREEDDLGGGFAITQRTLYLVFGILKTGNEMNEPSSLFVYVFSLALSPSLSFSCCWRVDTCEPGHHPGTGRYMMNGEKVRRRERGTVTRPRYVA